MKLEDNMQQNNQDIKMLQMQVKIRMMRKSHR